MPHPHSTESVPLSTFRSSHHGPPPSLLSPDQFQFPEDPSPSHSSDDLVHLSKETSRQPTPASSDLPHPDLFVHRGKISGRQEGGAVAGDREGFRESGADSDSDDGDNWVTEGVLAAVDHDPNMPSDLRPSLDRAHNTHGYSQPLLSGADKRRGSESGSHSHTLHHRRSARFRERDPESMARAATRKRYTYAACFLALSLVTFAIQTETAVYIQHDLQWNKAYCMLYFTHGSWSLLYPAQLLILRLQKWHQPWPVFWRRHKQFLRHTAQMVQHQQLHISPQLQKQSPIPYFVKTTAYVTCALTIAGGSWYVAVDLTTASDLTAIYNCSAFFAYAFAVPMLGEKLRISKILAVGVAIVGVLVVAYGDKGSTAKHGSKSGGGSGGPNVPPDEDAENRALGNIIIGVGSVLYGFYEVLYKRVACPPEGTSPQRGMIFANTFGSMIGTFTLLVLWIPLPILHVLGWETFALPTGQAAWMLAISVFANATFSGSFLVLISLTSPVLSSVAALLTIFLVALCDQMLPPPLYHKLTGAAIVGGLLIIGAFALLSWGTYREMAAEEAKHAEEVVEESEDEDY